MNDITSNLYAQMNEALEQVAIAAANTLQRAEQSYHVAKSTMDELKQHVLRNGFKDKEEEIMFFKTDKPLFLKELIYFRELFYVEANKPVGPPDTVSGYYRKIAQGISNFFERNQAIYTYYRTGKSDDDNLFFLRDTQHPFLLSEGMPDMDTRFCTSASFKFGKIQAFEKLNGYLLRALEQPELPADPGYEPQGSRPDVNWTDSKAQLIEVGYAFFAKSSVNNGKADIKLIMAALEYAFNISLGNYYGVFQQNIRLRKKDRTVYLHQLEDSLNKYMDGLDEHPRRYPIPGS